MTDTSDGPKRVPKSKTTYELTGKKEITFERKFDAAPEVVFAAFTNPKLVADWWGSLGSILEVKVMDVKPGGIWNFVETDSRGKRSYFHGEYQQIDAPKRIEMTLCYGKGAASKLFAIKEEYEFIKKGKGTLLRVTSSYPMGMALKGMLSVGMEHPGKNIDGSRHQWRLDRLAEAIA